MRSGLRVSDLRPEAAGHAALSAASQPPWRGAVGGAGRWMPPRLRFFPLGLAEMCAGHLGSNAASAPLRPAEWGGLSSSAPAAPSFAGAGGPQEHEGAVDALSAALSFSRGEWQLPRRSRRTFALHPCPRRPALPRCVPATGPDAASAPPVLSGLSIQTSSTATASLGPLGAPGGACGLVSALHPPSDVWMCGSLRCVCVWSRGPFVG